MIQTAYVNDVYSGASVSMYSENPVADAAGVKWGLFDIDGWSNGMDVKPAVFERPFHDGAVLDAFSYAARVMDLHGGFIAPSRLVAVQATRRLMRMFPIRGQNYQGGAMKTLFVDEFAPFYGGTGVIMEVRPTGAIELTPHNYGLGWEFHVPLIAPDPRKYAYTTQSVTAASVCTCTADGDVPTFLNLMRIIGPITDPVVTHDRTGWFMKLNATISAGTQVDFNMQTHEIVGTLRSRLDVASKWFPLLPDVNHYTLTGSGTSGATALRIDWRDAYQ